MIISVAGTLLLLQGNEFCQRIPYKTFLPGGEGAGFSTPAAWMTDS
jgi:hypothetical protein